MVEMRIPMGWHRSGRTSSSQRGEYCGSWPCRWKCWVDFWRVGRRGWAALSLTQQDGASLLPHYRYPVDVVYVICKAQKKGNFDSRLSSRGLLLSSVVLKFQKVQVNTFGWKRGLINFLTVFSSYPYKLNRMCVGTSWPDLQPQD